MQLGICFPVCTAQTPTNRGVTSRCKRTTISLAFCNGIRRQCGFSSSSKKQTPFETRLDPTVEVETVAEGLVRPWGIAFLGDGRMLVTELPGRLRIVEADGTLGDPIDGLPEVRVRNQGGLLDVALATRLRRITNVFTFLGLSPMRQAAT